MSDPIENLRHRMIQWTIENEERVKGLDREQAEKLKRWFGYLVDGIIDDVEAEERALLTELLGDLELEF